MRKVQSFSVDDITDKEVYELLTELSAKGNKSAYIVNLIKADLKKKKELFTEEQKEEIRNIIREFVSAGNEISLDKIEDKNKKDILDALSQFDN